MGDVLDTSPTPAPAPESAHEIVARFLAGTLDAEAWTHAAHLFVCRHVLAEADGEVAAALDRLRLLIRAHNERVGLLPYHGGYHETVTRYFTEAVAHVGTAPTDAELLADPACRGDAPAQHWTRAVLGSDAARRTWVAPDLVPLPWS